MVRLHSHQPGNCEEPEQETARVRGQAGTQQTERPRSPLLLVLYPHCPTSLPCNEEMTTKEMMKKKSRERKYREKRGKLSEA